MRKLFCVGLVLISTAIQAGDGLHPNQAGYRVMKPLAEKAIAAALKQKKS